MRLSTVFISHLNDLLLEIDNLDGDTELKQIMEYRMRFLRELAFNHGSAEISEKDLKKYEEVCREAVWPESKKSQNNLKK